MKCPVCKETNLTMTDRQGIEIDYCPQCRGVWLDRGELDKLVEHAERKGSDQSSGDQWQRNDRRDRDDDDDHRRERPGSFLRDLFD